MKTRAKRKPTTTDGGDRYSRLKDRAVLLLLTARTAKAAAKELGVSQVTLCTWMNREDFQLSLRQARERVFEEAMGRLLAGTLAAADHLIHVLDPKTRCGHGIKNQAASLLLPQGMKVANILVLGQQLHDLEEMVKARNRPEPAIDHAPQVPIDAPLDEPAIDTPLTTTPPEPASTNGFHDRFTDEEPPFNPLADNDPMIFG